MTCYITRARRSIFRHEFDVLDVEQQLAQFVDRDFMTGC